MGKQALGIATTNYHYRFDSIANLLYYPQRPLVTTRINEIMRSSELPSGQNIMVAIMCSDGYDIEDATIMNQSSVDRGLFRSVQLRTYYEEAKKNHAHGKETFENPKKDTETDITHMQQGNYDKLSDAGMVLPGTRVVEHDIIIAKTVTPKVNNYRRKTRQNALGSVLGQDEGVEEERKKRDKSVVVGKNEDAVVDRILKTVTPKVETIKLRTRQMRIPEIGDKFCFSPDHDILTTQGWVPVADLTYNHQIASMHNGNLVYESPTAILAFEGGPQMIEIKSNQVDLCVTPNHRMYIRRRGRLHFELCAADKLFNVHAHYKKNAMWHCDLALSTFTLPACTYQHSKHQTINFEARTLSLRPWTTFFGIWIAEGWVSRNHISIATNKLRVKEALEHALLEMAFTYTFTDGGNKLNIQNKQLVVYMQQFKGGALQKSLPEWAWKLDSAHAQSLLVGMLLGDGHMNGRTPMYDTSSIQLKDDTMRLALHCGWAANARVQIPKGRKHKIHGKMTTTHADSWRLTIVKRQVEPVVNKHIKDQQTLVPYSGKVHCCTVPSGLLYVRRQGKRQCPVWTGNSSRHGTAISVFVSFPTYTPTN